MVDETLVSDYFDDPLTAQLVQQVLAMQPGAQLQSERDQAEQLGVSRTALRDRLRHLEAVGVLERRSGAGTFVRQIQPEMVSQSLALGLMASHMTMPSLRSVRIALERQAAMEASQARDHVSIAQMHVAVDRMEATDDRAEMYAADLDFHHALFLACRSPGLKFFADSLSKLLSRSFVKLDTDEQRVQVRSVHRAIYGAVAAGDPIASMQAIDAHFDLLDKLNQHFESLAGAEQRDRAALSPSSRDGDRSAGLRDAHGAR
ncbi:FadR/GntR family transcriptional regulator [Streptomyces phaeochromogenes]|uniref:FadR/GntR family transcriptional regulator n=1 Tax=Streptomyces phaeochromogenes TaxID=1923 RepID=UPI002DDC8B23|nr:FCD domain-containing protein [Streptomyces phaeochromogenes]WRZ34581.1 FCD domain-containing protein [Streptomyces phaeochromogenes]